METQIPWTEIIMQAGYAGLLLYLTFRIFKLLDSLAAMIKDIKIVISIQANDYQNSSEDTNSSG